MGVNKFIGQGIFFFVRARVYSMAAALFLLVSPVFADTTKDIADLKSADLKIKYAALDNLKKISTPDVADALTAAALQEKDVRFTMALLDQISQTHREHVIPQLAPMLQHKNVVIRRRAVQTVGLLCGPLAEKPLLAALRREKDTDVKSAILQALGVCGGDEAVKAIQSETSASDKPQVRANANHALKRIERMQRKAKEAK